MYHLSKRIALPFLAIAALLIVSLACSPTGALPGGGAQGQPTPAASAPATSPAGQPTSSAKQPTATTASSTKPGGFPEVADLQSLSSYRSTMTTKGVDAKGVEHTSIIATEWVKTPPAQHITSKDEAGKTISEIVTIGDKHWMWMPTLGWREMPPQPEKPSDLPSDLESQIKKMQSDLPQARPTFTLLGTETIDGIRCKHYKFDIQFSMDLPNLAGGGTRKAEIHSSGEMWVADQSGLPAIIIQSKETMEMNLSGQKTVTQAERKVYDINKPITINPPEGAKPMPGGPTPPADRTPPPLQLTATSPTSGGQQATPVAGQPTVPPTGKKTVSLTVKGTDAIYLAGRADVTIPPVDAEDSAFPLGRCGGDSQETVPVPLVISPGVTVTFKATGAIDYYGSTTETGPDGDEAASDISGLDGISGYNGPQGALVGVFLDDANPKDKPDPGSLDFSGDGLGTTFATLTPAVGQVFFIGDGLAGTGSGAIQTFAVPADATRLFLGIADASGFVGEPGCYGDNVDAFQVQVAGTGLAR